jgi:uncharacterized membrane protein
MSDRQIRASSADRERVAEALRDHYAAGRISEDELGERHRPRGPRRLELP